MGKQKIVLKLRLDDDRKRKAFKAAVGMNGVTSATMEGDKIIVVGEGVDPIALTRVLRRGLGYAELLSVTSGDDKKKGNSYAYGSGKDHGHGYGGHHTAAPVSYPAYHQCNALPSYPVYSYPAYPHQQQDPGCSIM